LAEFFEEPSYHLDEEFRPLNTSRKKNTPQEQRRLFTPSEETATVDRHLVPVSPKVKRKPGDVLFHDVYMLVEWIGSGGMGEVWKAHSKHHADDQFVAIKFLPAEVQRDVNQRQNVTKTFQRFFGVRHNNLCHVEIQDDEDTSEKEGHGLFLIMDYVDGKPLNKFRETVYLELEKENKLKPYGIAVSYAAFILKPIAEALDFLHALPATCGSGKRAIIHRDVKPSNIMVDKDEKIYLVDYGIAAEVCSELERTATSDIFRAVGTPSYMSPEAFLDPKAGLHSFSDQYSFAVVVYEFICGKRPYAHSYGELFRHFLLHQPPLPIPWLNKWANSVLLRALSKEPSERYSSCAEFIYELARAADGILSESGARDYVNQLLTAVRADDEMKLVKLKSYLNCYTSIEAAGR